MTHYFVRVVSVRIFLFCYTDTWAYVSVIVIGYCPLHWISNNTPYANFSYRYVGQQKKIDGISRCLMSEEFALILCLTFLTFNRESSKIDRRILLNAESENIFLFVQQTMKNIIYNFNGLPEIELKINIFLPSCSGRIRKSEFANLIRQPKRLQATIKWQKLVWSLMKLL